MKRRGGRSSPISLFAFQDIIASVIGMVFVVVLIMALSIVNAKAVSEAVRLESITDSDLQTLRERASESEAEIRAIAADIVRLTGQLDLASGDEEVALDEVKRLEATLKNLYARVREEQDAVGQADAERQRIVEKYEDRLRESQRLDRQLAELRTRIQTTELRPRLAFIIDPHPDDLEPWLLEISGSRLRVASKDGTSAILEFGGESFERRKERFLAWLSSQSNRTHYFVLLIKPSGIEQADECGKILKSKGYDIGKDLLPEDWAPF